MRLANQPAGWVTRSRDAYERISASFVRARVALLAYVVVRAAGVLWVAYRAHGFNTTFRSHLDARYDSLYYVYISQYGYGEIVHGACSVQGPHCEYAFFPMYTWLIRFVHAVVGGDYGYVALAVALVSSVVAAWGIFSVAEFVLDRRAGIAAVILWGILPHSVVESIAYSEAPFVAFASWALYCALRQRWISAALLTVLAGLTRPVGVAVVLAVEVGMIAALWSTRGQRSRATTTRIAAAMAIAPLGWLGWVAWVGYKVGAWNGYELVQRAWRTGIDEGGYTLHNVLAIFNGGRTPPDTIEIAATLFAAVVLMIVAVQQREPLVLLVYSAAVLALTLGTTGYFHSKARFLIAGFTLVLPMARALSRADRWVAATVLTAAAAASTLYGGYVLIAVHVSP